MKIKNIKTVDKKKTTQLFVLTDCGQVFLRDIIMQPDKDSLFMSDWVDVTNDLPSQ